MIGRLGKFGLKLGTGRMIEAEYRANLNGLNIFFGAVLGFVMAGTETMSEWMFAYVLMLLSGLVVAILYISASQKRVQWAVLALVMVFAAPEIIRDLLDGKGALPPKVRPTMLV